MCSLKRKQKTDTRIEQNLNRPITKEEIETVI